MQAGLSAQDLAFNYGSKKALAGVSFDLPPGQFCALLGPNGAGKSTLISLLTRLLVAPQGQITIAGHDLQAEPGPALGALGVVFQQPTLDLDLTVHQNLAYFAALHAIPRAEIVGRIQRALEQLDMQERAHEKVRALNGGHRRRTELARALLHDPKVLLLDEPTVGLDAAARASITAHVHDLASQGLTVLWTTHLTDEVHDSDRLLVLHRGTVIEDGVAGQIRGVQSLSDWFLDRTGAAA
ncbi:MAG: ABC transporter ATP-binding protein [Pseudomonadota bacterium]